MRAQVESGHYGSGNPEPALLHPPLRTNGALCWPPAEKVVDLLPALPLRAEALGRREDFERLRRRELRGPKAAAPRRARANPCRPGGARRQTPAVRP
jgi:hypothetical protein